MLAHSCPCGRRARIRGWVPCRAAAIELPHRGLLRRSGDRRGEDLRRPAATVSLHFPWLVSCPFTMPMFLSTVAILLFAFGLSSLLVTSFSNASTTPSLHRIPTAVPPFSTAFTAY